MRHGRRLSGWGAAVAAFAGPALAVSASPGEEAAPTLYLVAARQKPRIAESLRRVGIQLADDILDAPLLLRVTVGNEKGFRSCGTRNNVKYALRVQGATALELAEAGWTGACEPNVFDSLSEQLARALAKPSEGGTR